MEQLCYSQIQIGRYPCMSELSEIDTQIEPEGNTGEEAKEVQAVQILKINKLAKVCGFGFMVNVVLALASLFIVFNRTPYSGPLQKYLPIFSGEIHYARLPYQYWQHRILMLKAMGLNTLSVYVMWNYHQLYPKQFDFHSENRNITLFLQLAKKHEMNVLLRPGPYVCAQWDFGGLPARLLGIQDMEIRSANKLYEQEVREYFTALAPLIRPYLASQGGPIIMIQIENELGYIRDSPTHTLNLLSLWKSLGVEGEFYYEDPGELWENNYWPGAHIGLSESSDILKYLNIELSPRRSKSSLIFGGEVYSGWFTDWGTGWALNSPAQFSQKIENIINHNRSVSLYMGYGGTNFAMTAGANGFNPLYSYMPHVTSYDYDSPVSEGGMSTVKYSMLREVFQKYYGAAHKMIDIPPPMKTIGIKDINVGVAATLFANLGQAIVTNGELTYFQSDTLKMYNQGLVLYQTLLPSSQQYSFSLTVRDYAIVFVDQTFVTTLQRGDKEKFTIEVKCITAPCKLRMLVQAMGHINFGKYQGNDRKGLFDFMDNNNSNNLFKWKIYKIELSQSVLTWDKSNHTIPFPRLYKGQFNLSQTGDTFIDMSKWSKGYVWVNQRNLGRYWNIGPQYRLYCPGVWLKAGMNQIAILELSNVFGSIEAFQTMR